MPPNPVKSRGLAAEFSCPGCASPIPLADINVSTDIALCRLCAKSFPLSSLQPAIPGLSTLGEPPKGISLSTSPDGSHSLTYQKIGWQALILVPFTIIWSACTWIKHYAFLLYSQNFDPVEILGYLPTLGFSIIQVCLCAWLIVGKTTFRITPSREFSYFKGALGIGRRISLPLPQPIAFHADKPGSDADFKGARKLHFMPDSGNRFATYSQYWNPQTETYILAWLAEFLPPSRHVHFPLPDTDNQTYHE